MIRKTALHLPTRLAAALLLAPGLILAQDAPDLWHTQIELGFNGSSGNSSFSILRTGATLTRSQSDLYEFELSGLLRYGKSEDRVIANDLRGTVKFDWRPLSDFSPFTFVTASRDEIRKLDAKVNGGFGAKWTFVRNDGRTKASVSLAGIVDYENYRLEAGSTDAESERSLRWSGRLKFDHTFESGANFQHVTFFQPKVDSFSDYIVQIYNTISTKLLSNLTLALQHEYLHDAVPPPGVKPDDQKFSAVLRIIL